MEISLTILPPFLLERLELVWENIVDDFESRQKESRAQKLVSYRLITGEEPPAILVENAQVSYYWYDWDDLFEWNERLHESRFFLLLQIYKKRVAQNADHLLAGALLERLDYLESEAQQARLSQDPTWIELWRYRWRASLWREECRALGEIIEKELSSET